MIFTYYVIGEEKNIDIDINDIFILYPIMNGTSTAVMFKKDGIDNVYVMFNKFETIPLNNNFMCIYKHLKVYVNTCLITSDVDKQKFHNLKYIIRQEKLKQLLKCT